MSTTGGVLDRRPVSGPEFGDADDWVHRFGRTERFVHWWTVVMVAVALLTGLTLGDDGTGSLFPVHVGSMVALAAGVAGALLIGDRRALLAAVRALFVLDRRDRAWLTGIVGHPLRRPAEPRWGMFNAAQKLLTWAVTASLAAVIVTGILAWNGGGEDGGPHPAFVVVTGVLLAGHVFMALVNPSTRHALNGMVRGRVRRSWAAVHHAEWADQARPVDGSR